MKGEKTKDLSCLSRSYSIKFLAEYRNNSLDYSFKKDRVDTDTEFRTKTEHCHMESDESSCLMASMSLRQPLACRRTQVGRQ